MRLPEALTIPNAEGTFCGTPVAQNWNDLALWEEFFNRYPIASLIELGTWKGGMGAFFATQCLARNIRFTTIDSNPAWLENRELIEKLGGTCLNADIFAADFMKEIIAEMPKPLLLFCDNGDKRREIRDIAHLVSQNDFIAVHDWNSECGPADIPDRWDYLMQSECEAISSLTRFFEIAE